MSTRGTMVIKDNKGKVILSMYRQMDSYFYGHGREVVDFISKGKLVNGFSFDAKFGEVFNGMGDLASQLIAHLKRPKKDYSYEGKGERKIQSVGSIYITAPIKKGDKQEFNYELSCNKNDEIILMGEGYAHGDNDEELVKPEEWVQLYPLTELSKKLLKMDKPSIND